MTISSRKSASTSMMPGVALLLLTLMPAAVAAQDHHKEVRPAAPVAAGQCAPTISKYKVSKSPVSTTSISYVNVGDTNLSFVQGGTKASCVIVSFSAEASAAVDTFMMVRVLLDGTTACEPSGTYFVQYRVIPMQLNAHAMNFVCPNVAPGSHGIVVQYRSNAGGSVTLDFRTTIAHFVP